MDPGNQAHTQEAGTHQGHIQNSCKVIQTYKTLETEMQAEMKYYQQGLNSHYTK